MTRNRQKQSNSSEKTSPPSQEDAPPKKTPKSASSNGLSGTGAQGPSHSRSCLGLIVSAVCYIAVIGAAGFAAFYLQQVVEEIRQSGVKQEERAQQSAELHTKMESVIQQVGDDSTYSALLIQWKRMQMTFLKLSVTLYMDITRMDAHFFVLFVQLHNCPCNSCVSCGGLGGY